MMPTVWLLPMMVALVCLPESLGLPDYGARYSGDGTYYGPPGTVHCTLPAPYLGLSTVALNSAQYDGGRNCGACVEITGSGVGAGANPIVGTKVYAITNECPTCSYGDLDLGLSGDGRWRIQWRFVPCPSGGANPKLIMQGSNPYYIKAQGRYLDSPMKTFTLSGMSNPAFTVDNFAVFQNSQGFRTPLLVEITSALGTRYTGSIPSISDGVEFSLTRSGAAPSSPIPRPPIPRPPSSSCTNQRSEKGSGMARLSIRNQKNVPVRVYRVRASGYEAYRFSVSAKKSKSRVVDIGSFWKIKPASGQGCLLSIRVIPGGRMLTIP